MRARIAAGAVLVLAHFYAFPFFCELRSANEMPRILLVQEIVDRGTVRIDARLGELGSRFDVSTTPAGHHYSNKAPGVSFMAVPIYGAMRLVGLHPTIETATWAFRIGAVTIPCLLFLILLYGLLDRFVPPEGEPAAKKAAFLGYALGSMAFPYAILFFSHSVAAACVGAAFALAVELCRGNPRRPRLLAVALGFLAAWSVVVDYQAVLAAAVVGVYLIGRSRTRIRDVFLAATGAVPAAVLLLAYHQLAFGSPFKTGYSFAVDPAHKQGVLGIVGPNAQALWNAFLAPDNGLLVLCPWVVLAIVGAIAIAIDPLHRIRIGWEALACGAIAVLYALFIGSLEPELGRGGWEVGPRYITVALPFIACLAAAGLAQLDRVVALRTVAHALVLCGVVVYVVAATTYPHWPIGFENPLYEVSFRALSEGMTPPSLGKLAGIGGTEALLPLYALVLAFSLALLGGKNEIRWVTTGLAAVLAAGIVIAYGQFPGSGAVGEAKWKNVQKTTECHEQAAQETGRPAFAN